MFRNPASSPRLAFGWRLSVWLKEWVRFVQDAENTTCGSGFVVVMLTIRIIIIILIHSNDNKHQYRAYQE